MLRMHRIRIAFRCAAAAAALLLSARPGVGQIVRGTVVEEGGVTPVQGAMVILMGREGVVIRRVLTDAGGGFIAQTDRPGPHTIRVDRIGYESLTTQPFDVPVEGVVRRIEVPIRPVELLGLDVEGARRCSVRAEQGRATARVWEEARKALQAAAWTLSSGTYHYTLLQFERNLDPDGRRLVSEKRQFVRSTAQAPYVSAPIEELTEQGFIRLNEDGTATYFAPDAEAFLSDAFLDAHCMRLDGVRDGMVALEFQPIAGRRVPEIEGTLWIEAATAALRRLEFRYVNLPEGRDRGSADGQVTFGSLPNGTWVVRDWSLRLPMLGMQADRSTMYLLGYVEQGGRVWRVTRPDGTTVLEAVTATVSGTVVDSLEGGPVAGGRIRSAGDPETSGVVLAADGTFMLGGLPPGAQVLQVHHPSLDTLGLGPASFPVEGKEGEIASVRLRLPGVLEMLRAVCADDPVGNDGAAILGRVRGASGPDADAPRAPGASGASGASGAAPTTVRVRLRGSGPVVFSLAPRAAPPRADREEGPQWTMDPEEEGWVTTTLDERGIFLLCGVSSGARLLVQAALADGASGETVVAVGRADDALLVTIPIERGR
jgi:hypothetical protein